MLAYIGHIKIILFGITQLVKCVFKFTNMPIRIAFMPIRIKLSKMQHEGYVLRKLIRIVRFEVFTGKKSGYQE